MSSTPEDVSQGNLENSNEALEEEDTIVWEPENGEVNEDDSVVVLNYAITDEHTQVIDLVFEPAQDIEPTSAGSVNNVHEEVLQDAQDRGLDGGDQSWPLHSSSQNSGLTVPANVESQQSQRHVSVLRVKVVEDLIGAFSDDSIMYETLKMEIVNEKAVDDSGVSREVYTAFLESFLEQAEGESERVPRLRPDFNQAHWKAVGRIWAKGLLDHGVIPVKLSKAFTVACIYGMDSVDVDVLMSSFLNYIPDVERSAVERVLQGSLEESDKDDLLDLFTRMGSHVLPNENNFETVLETVAHKTILQEPKYIVDCLTGPMTHVKLNLPNKEDLLSLYESKKATGKRVLATDRRVTVSERTEHLQLPPALCEKCRPSKSRKVSTLLHRFLCHLCWENLGLIQQ